MASPSMASPPVKVGRKPLHPTLKRAHGTNVKWTDAEYQRLIELAGRRPLAEYIRESVLMRVA